MGTSRRGQPRELQATKAATHDEKVTYRPRNLDPLLAGSLLCEDSLCERCFLMTCAPSASSGRELP